MLNRTAFLFAQKKTKQGLKNCFWAQKLHISQPCPKTLPKVRISLALLSKKISADLLYLKKKFFTIIRLNIKVPVSTPVLKFHCLKIRDFLLPKIVIFQQKQLEALLLTSRMKISQTGLKFSGKGPKYFAVRPTEN